MPKLKKPYDIKRLATTMSVAKSFSVGYSTLVFWLDSGAPRPEVLRSPVTGRRLMMWSEQDIENLRRWMIAKGKTFKESRAVLLQQLIRRHALQIEDELNSAPERKPDDALVHIARSVYKDLQRRKEKLSPNVVAEIIADALCEQTHGFSPSDELRVALMDAVMPAVVSGLGLLN